MAGTISMGARREVLSAVAERYRSAGRVEKGRILDALCRTTGWHRKHAVRALRRRVVDKAAEAPRERKRRYGATIKDALTALWEASDRVCGKRLVVMIPTLVPALERHGRLQLDDSEQAQLLTVSAATIDRMLGDVKIAAAGGRRRRAGFYSAIRREVPIRTFNDWKDPAPGFCEVDMVARVSARLTTTPEKKNGRARQSANSAQATREVSDGEAPVTSVNCTTMARSVVKAKASVATAKS